MTETLSLSSGPLESEDDFNLTVVRANGSVLMGRKTRGYGKGKLVLPGGKTRYYLDEAGMGVFPPSEEAAREAAEETGVTIDPVRLTPKGNLYIEDDDETKVVRIFEARIKPGAAFASGELSDLGWQPDTALPFEQMPPDYRLWLSQVLAGYAVTGFFNNQGSQLISARLFRQKQDPLGRLEEVDLAPYDRSL